MLDDERFEISRDGVKQLLWATNEMRLRLGRGAGWEASERVKVTVSCWRSPMVTEWQMANK